MRFLLLLWKLHGKMQLCMKTHDTLVSAASGRQEHKLRLEEKQNLENYYFLIKQKVKTTNVECILCKLHIEKTRELKIRLRTKLKLIKQ